MAKVTIRRGDTMSQAFTALGDITGRTELWFTVKEHPDDTDANAIIQIDEGSGLIRLNKADATARAANGSITVSDQAAGDLTVALDEAETDDLTRHSGLYYDIQVLNAGAVSTLTASWCNITMDVTTAVV